MLRLLSAIHIVLRIFVIDSGVNMTDASIKSHLCRSGHLNLTDTPNLRDEVGHGTVVAKKIIEYAGKSHDYCLVIVKTYTSFNTSYEAYQNEVEAVRYAAEAHPAFVNISAGGPGDELGEKASIKSAPNTIFVVAAGNEDHDIDQWPYYPASYGLENIVPVGSVENDSSRAYYSNYGESVAAWESGTDSGSGMRGTSVSAAIHTGKLVRQRLKQMEKTHGNP